MVRITAPEPNSIPSSSLTRKTQTSGALMLPENPVTADVASGVARAEPGAPPATNGKKKIIIEETEDGWTYLKLPFRCDQDALDYCKVLPPFENSHRLLDEFETLY